jgi:hypothetical protein
VLLLAAVDGVGQDVDDLAAFTGYDRDWIVEVAERLERSGIWRDGVTYGDWADDETGGIAFWMDVSVAQGLLIDHDRGGNLIIRSSCSPSRIR